MGSAITYFLGDCGVCLERCRSWKFFLGLLVHICPSPRRVWFRVLNLGEHLSTRLGLWTDCFHSLDLVSTMVSFLLMCQADGAPAADGGKEEDPEKKKKKDEKVQRTGLGL